MSTTIEECAPDYLSPFCCETVRLYTAYTK